jgi:hypothetical protein
MMIKWRGDRLWYLINKTNEELRIIYPDNTINSLKTTKKEYKQRIAKAEIMSPETPKDYNPEDSPEVIRDRIRSTDELSKIAQLIGRAGVEADDIDHIRRVNLYQMGYKDEDGEAQTKDLVSISYKPRQDVTELIEAFVPATPAKITPSKRKAIKRDYDTLFVFSDLQMGFREYDGEQHAIHDERAMEVARLICRDVQPKIIVNLGDTVDLSSLSKFKPDSNHFMNELGTSFQAIHDYYAKLRSDNPNAEIKEVSSNHNQRFVDAVLKNFPDMYNVKQAGATEEDWPVLSYPYLANLKHLGVEWIGGYPGGVYEHGKEYDAPSILLAHGTENTQNGTTAAKIMKNKPETHNVQGHDHTRQSCCHTLRNGRVLRTIVVGALCRVTGEVSSYKSSVDDRNHPVRIQENWQQGVLVIRDYKNGEYEFTEIAIENGKAKYNGKEYDGNQ